MNSPPMLLLYTFDSCYSLSCSLSNQVLSKVFTFSYLLVNVLVNDSNFCPFIGMTLLVLL